MQQTAFYRNTQTSDFHFASQYLVIAHLPRTQQHEYPEEYHTTTSTSKQITRLRDPKASQTVSMTNCLTGCSVRLQCGSEGNTPRNV